MFNCCAGSHKSKVSWKTDTAAAGLTASVKDTGTTGMARLFHKTVIMYQLHIAMSHEVTSTLPMIAFFMVGGIEVAAFLGLMLGRVKLAIIGSALWCSGIFTLDVACRAEMSLSIKKHMD